MLIYEAIMQEYIKILSTISNKKTLEKGSILFFEGEKANDFFILLKGVVRIYKSLNKEITLHQFCDFNFIAEMPAFKGLVYPANAECKSKCEILCINYKKFEELCIKDNRFNFLFICSLFEKIKILERKLMQNLLNLKDKFVKYILDNEEKLQILSQKQIALDLDISAQSLSRIIKEFKKNKIIDTKKGKIILLNKKELNNLVGFNGF